MNDPNFLDARLVGLSIGCRTHPLGGIEISFQVPCGMVSNVLPADPTVPELYLFFDGLTHCAARLSGKPQ